MNIFHSRLTFWAWCHFCGVFVVPYSQDMEKRSSRLAISSCYRNASIYFIFLLSRFMAIRTKERINDARANSSKGCHLSKINCRRPKQSIYIMRPPQKLFRTVPYEHHKSETWGTTITQVRLYANVKPYRHRDTTFSTIIARYYALLESCGADLNRCVTSFRVMLQTAEKAIPRKLSILIRARHILRNKHRPRSCCK